jgi:hypothetical protein
MKYSSLSLFAILVGLVPCACNGPTPPQSPRKLSVTLIPKVTISADGINALDIIALNTGPEPATIPTGLWSISTLEAEAEMDWNVGREEFGGVSERLSDVAMKKISLKSGEFCIIRGLSVPEGRKLKLGTIWKTQFLYQDLPEIEFKLRQIVSGVVQIEGGIWKVGGSIPIDPDPQAGKIHIVD